MLILVIKYLYTIFFSVLILLTYFKVVDNSLGVVLVLFQYFFKKQFIANNKYYIYKKKFNFIFQYKFAFFIRIQNQSKVLNPFSRWQMLILLNVNLNKYLGNKIDLRLLIEHSDFINRAMIR